MEILRTIALLCQINGAGGESGTITNYIIQQQLNCQQHYVKCLNNDNLATYKTLSACILKRAL